MGTTETVVASIERFGLGDAVADVEGFEAVAEVEGMRGVVGANLA